MRAPPRWVAGPPGLGSFSNDLALILLAVAAVAALLGFGRLSGAALTGAKVLIGIVLVLFLLVLLGVIALAA